MKNFKKAIALLLAAVLLVAASVMGTIAYLTDSDKDVNTMSAGNVYIVQNETDRNGGPYVDKQKLVPAVFNGTDYENVLDKFVTVTNTGTEPAYVRTILLFENNADNEVMEKIHLVMDDTDGQNAVWLLNADGTPVLVNVNGTNYSIAVCTYDSVLAKDATTAPSLEQVYLDPTADNSWYDLLGDDGEFSIIAFSQAVQAQGFDNAENALNTAFGEVTSAAVAEWVATTGIASTGDKNIIGGVTKP